MVQVESRRSGVKGIGAPFRGCPYLCFTGKTTLLHRRCESKASSCRPTSFHLYPCTPFYFLPPFPIILLMSCDIRLSLPCCFFPPHAPAFGPAVFGFTFVLCVGILFTSFLVQQYSLSRHPEGASFLLYA